MQKRFSVFVTTDGSFAALITTAVVVVCSCGCGSCGCGWYINITPQLLVLSRAVTVTRATRDIVTTIYIFMFIY